MATQVQLRRGTTAEHSAFTGAVGEVTVDTDLDTLRVHDGAAAGGHRLAKFSDLTGIGAFITGRLTGRYYLGWPSLGGSNGALTLNTLYAVPFLVGASQSFDRIATASLGTASSTIRFGIYADAGLRPGTLILDTGAISAASSAVCEATISQTLSGLVWICGVGQGVAPSTTRLALLPNGLIGTTSPFTAIAGFAYSQTGITGALPDPWGSTYTNEITANVVPQLYLRAA